MKRIALGVGVVLVLAVNCASEHRAPEASKRGSANLTTQAWRGPENVRARLWSIDGRSLRSSPPGQPPAKTAAGVEIPEGVPRLRVEPGAHEIEIRYDPDTVYEMDRPGKPLHGKLQALPVIRPISLETRAGRVYVVRARTWVRTGTGLPDATSQRFLRWPGPQVYEVAERCDAVWILDKKTGKQVACRAYPEGCMSCAALPGGS